ncbi:hypothetical protein [Amycolatopsis sp. 195334CR]|uniref:hypothetical protein n=1 Tax=Amycolatopsis sp. 195334CR TaxID=2814588 RepID=UPI001A8DB6F0|nr:hypothetical protein [Amycolatopsis sp. 195334CR]MBN6039762.1 hypothetical protein [Amycolatopsis sp. 195334CR]
MRRTNGAARVLWPAALLAPLVFGLAPAAAAAPAACTWSESVLPMPAGALAGDVAATDNSGGYAGTISFGADSEQGGPAVLWKNGQFTNYGYLPDPAYDKFVSVQDVNGAGTVVGTAFTADWGIPSAIRSRDGKLERLPELPGGTASQAEGINERGDIVGAVETEVDGGPFWHPVLWPADRPGEVVELTGLPETQGYATGIDQDGTVLVEVDDPDQNRVPYLWKDGAAKPLPLPGGGYDVITRGISNGRVIGQVSYESGDAGGVVWDRNGRPTAVARGADLQDINGNGRIVGRTDAPDWDEYGVWNLAALDSTLGYTAERGLELRVSSDDGTIAGRTWKFPGGRDEPTVWKCA